MNWRSEMTAPSSKLKLWEAWTFDANGRRVDLGMVEGEDHYEARVVAQVVAMEKNFDYFKVQVKERGAPGSGWPSSIGGM